MTVRSWDRFARLRTRGRAHEAARIFMEGWGQPGQYDKMPKAGQDAIATALTHVARGLSLGQSVAGRPDHRG